MINNKKFSKRLKIVIDFYQLSAAAFAEKISVQRSSISHLLSGRNKPSLDFVLKVLAVFDEVDFHWLVIGEGSFPKSEKSKNSTTPTLFSQNLDKESKSVIGVNDSTDNNSIERIVIFYANGRFKEYLN